MTYDPSLPSTRDRIRFIVGDTSDEPVFPDATYDSIIADHTNWKRAAAAMAESIAVAIEQDPSSFTAVGDMSVGWSDRTRSLREIAGRLRREAAAEDVPTAIGGVQSVQLGRDDAGVDGEYRSRRRRFYRGC